MATNVPHGQDFRARVISEVHKLMTIVESDRKSHVALLHTNLEVPITAECPVACLGLPSIIHFRVTREGGRAMSIADVIALITSGGVEDIRGLGLRSIGDVKLALTSSGFSVPGRPD